MKHHFLLPLVFMLLFHFASDVYAQESIANLKNDITRLERQLQSLYDQSASVKEIRKIRIQLQDKRDRLEDILAAQESGVISDGFGYLEREFVKAYNDAGASYRDVFFERVSGNLVRLAGRVGGVRSNSVLFFEDRLEEGKPYVYRLGEGGYEWFSLLIEYRSYGALRSLDFGRLKYLGGKYVTIEGEINSYFRSFVPTGDGVIVKLRLTDWAIVDE